MSDRGNVVLGLSSETFLMVDVDYSEQADVLAFAKEYAKYYSLGSCMVWLTSIDGQLDMNGKQLKKFAIIFGKPITFLEIQWHIREIRRLGMCERKFLNARRNSYITIRVNAKNDSIPYPKRVVFFRNGDTTGIKHYLEYWKTCKNLGFRKPVKQKKPLPSDISLVEHEISRARCENCLSMSIR